MNSPITMRMTSARGSQSLTITGLQLKLCSGADTDKMGNHLVDVEDEESSPITSTPTNGNLPISPLMEQPTLINNHRNLVRANSNRNDNMMLG